MRKEVLQFGHVADAYERGRPDYPQAVVDWIVAQAGLGAGTTVVDLAAGTGKLTRLLVETPARVVAVEPVAGMRSELSRVLPDVEAIDGTAEQMGLPTASADAVTVAQAFHWFAHDEALAEIARVLRPGGLLAVVWNRRDESQDLQAAITGVIEGYREEEPQHATGAWRKVLELSQRFEPVGTLETPNEQPLDADGLEDRVGSISFVAKLDAASRAAVIEQVRALAGGGTVTLRYVTEVAGYRSL